MRRIAAFFLCFLALSCQRRASVDMDAIPFVNSILSDRSSPEYRILASHSSVPVEANIYIVGDAESCDILSGCFLYYDRHDNVDGQQHPDGLPDFSGETLTEVVDNFAVPYYGFLHDRGETNMREHFIRHILHAVDTVCNLTRYDIDGRGHKPEAKVLIFADPMFSHAGRQDADVLVNGTSCGLDILCPFELSCDELFSSDAESFNVGILCDSTHVGFSLYKELLSSKSGGRAVGCFSCSIPESGGILTKFLDAYRSSGGRQTLDALLIDNCRVNISSLESELSDIRDLNRPECMTYGKLISPSFRIIDGSSVTAETCYSILRNGNLFTHKIAYPRVTSLETVKHPDAEQNYFLLVPTDNVQN